MKPNNRSFVFFLVLILFGPAAFFLAALGPAAFGQERAADSFNEVWILHTNDHHGALEPENHNGALPQLATQIRQIRNQAEKVGAAVLLLDAGDINSGSPVSDAFRGLPDLFAYNEIGYDAMAIGNHEFDNGLDCLKYQQQQARFPFLCANIQRQDGQYWGKPYVIKTCGKVKVGVFGLTVANKTIISIHDPDLVLLNEISVARQMVKTLRDQEKVDLVVALTHLGILEEIPTEVTSIELAKQVPGIDVIVDGHSHTAMESPLVVSGTPIVTAHCRSDRLGFVRFVPRSIPADSSAVVPVDLRFEFSWKYYPINDSIPPDPAVENLLAPFLDRLKAIRETVVGHSAAELPFGDKLPRRQETALGNLLCDATIWLGNESGERLDFVIHNGGGVRVGMPQGPITEETVATCFPFHNSIVFVTLSGQQVLDLFRHVEQQPPGTGAFPQVSRSVRYKISFDEKQAGALSDLTIDSRPVDPNRFYRVGTNSYMTSGGNGYTILKSGTNQKDSGVVVRDMVMRYLRQLPQPFEVSVDGHVQVEVK